MKSEHFSLGHIGIPWDTPMPPSMEPYRATNLSETEPSLLIQSESLTAQVWPSWAFQVSWSGTIGATCRRKSRTPWKERWWQVKQVDQNIGIAHGSQRFTWQTNANNIAGCGMATGHMGAGSVFLRFAVHVDPNLQVVLSLELMIYERQRCWSCHQVHRYTSHLRDIGMITWYVWLYTDIIYIHVCVCYLFTVCTFIVFIYWFIYSIVYIYWFLDFGLISIIDVGTVNSYAIPRGHEHGHEAREVIARLTKKLMNLMR